MTRRAAFTLVELLAVLGIIAVLAGLLLGGVMSVRSSAQLRKTEQVVVLLGAAVRAYADEHVGAFPEPDAVGTFAAPGVGTMARRATGDAAPGVLDRLDDRGLLALPEGVGPGEPVRDAWGNPLRYALTRPAPATGAWRLKGLLEGGGIDPSVRRACWNWNPDPDEDGNPQDGRERAWGRRWDPANGRESEGALPFPYIWSLGPEGASDDAARWVYQADGV